MKENLLTLLQNKKSFNAYKYTAMYIIVRWIHETTALVSFQLLLQNKSETFRNLK
jgi:hypothetical protein